MLLVVDTQNVIIGWSSMSLDEIIGELPKLTPVEQQQIYLQVEQLEIRSRFI
jgi:hypothetical protein